MNSESFLYRHNKKAWMTTELFAEWLKSIDRRMENLGKQKVILLLDNFFGHKASKMKDLPQLRRTQILYLPANTTSKFQPMAAGIIRNFKLYYHKRFNRYILQRLEKLEETLVQRPHLGERAHRLSGTSPSSCSCGVLGANSASCRNWSTSGLLTTFLKRLFVVRLAPQEVQERTAVGV